MPSAAVNRPGECDPLARARDIVVTIVDPEAPRLHARTVPGQGWPRENVIPISFAATDREPRLEPFRDRGGPRLRRSPPDGGVPPVRPGQPGDRQAVSPR